MLADHREIREIAASINTSTEDTQNTLYSRIGHEKAICEMGGKKEKFC